MCFQKFSDNKKIYFCKTFYTHKMYEQKKDTTVPDKITIFFGITLFGYSKSRFKPPQKWKPAL